MTLVVQKDGSRGRVWDPSLKTDETTSVSEYAAAVSAQKMSTTAVPVHLLGAVFENLAGESMPWHYTPPPPAPPYYTAATLQLAEIVRLGELALGSALAKLPENERPKLFERLSELDEPNP